MRELTASLLFVVCVPASLAAPPQEDPVDVTPVKQKLKLLSDKKGHYIALVPFESMDEYFFYGDGKTFWAQRTLGGGSEGTVAFNRSFWEPRVSAPYKASFDFRDQKYTLTCDERKTEFAPVADAEAKPLLEAGKFMRPRWKRQAYLLARDNSGRYYYVDKQREPEGNKNFRLFVGPKGNIKLQKMINIVSDSEGDIFSTRTGELRLVMDKHESTWFDKKTKTKLIQVPIENNHVLIYTDLGVYTGEPLGTPCDDL
jgi:hypothetical protein